MSAERSTTYHLDSWEALVAQRDAEADPKGPYHRTFDSVRVQANNLYRKLPPEVDQAAKDRKLNDLRAEVYMNNKRDKESGASKSRSMAAIVPRNNNNDAFTMLVEVVNDPPVSTAEVGGVGPTRLTFRERCDRLLGLLWWDKVDETLLPRADARRELCRSILHIVELGGMGSPDEPDYAMTLLLYWCQQSINHQVNPISALSREQLRHNCELIYRALSVTGRSVYIPPFLQPHLYKIVGKFSENGAAVFGLLWLFRDHWPMSKVPSCGSMADAELHTLTRYVIPLVTSCIERRATEREWLRELCRLCVRLSPQHMEHAGIFHTDEGFLLEMRDTAFGKQLEAHVYEHVKDEAVQYSLFKYIDRQGLYLAHVQHKLQQQAQLRSAIAEQTAEQIVSRNEYRQWLQEYMQTVRRHLAHPTLRRRVVELVAGPELKLLSRYNAPSSFQKRGVPAAAAAASGQWDKGSLQLHLGQFPRQFHTVERQQWNICRDHAFTAEDQQHFRQERVRQRQLRKKRRAKRKQRGHQREKNVANWAEVNDIWKSEPTTPPPFLSATSSERDDEDADGEMEEDFTAPLDPNQRHYYHALWRRHVVFPVLDHRLSPRSHEDATPTEWTAFRQRIAQLNEQENSEFEGYLRNGVELKSPCSSDADIDQSKEVNARLVAAVVREPKETLPKSSIAQWTLRSTEGLFECALHPEGVQQA